MKDINLIPRPRLAVRELKTCLRGWLGFYCFYVLLIASVLACCWATWATPAGVSASQELKAQMRQTAAIAQSLGRTQRELRRTEKELDATKVARNQPDWSNLLAILSDQLGGDVVLDSCELAPAGGGLEGQGAASQTGQTCPPPSPGQFRLVFAGFGRTQTSVSRFVLRIEQCDLFRNVRLVKTNRQPFLSGQAVAFSIECQI